MIDRKTVKAFQSHLPTLLSDLTEFNGQAVTLKKGSSARFDPTTGEIKISLTFVLGDEEEGKKAEWALHACRFGLAPEDFGRTFKTRTGTATISGLNLSARKRPIIATMNGREYVFPAEAVTKALRPWNISTEHGITGFYWYSDAEDDAKKEAEWKEAQS
jgi:hypothetical protein